MSVSDRFWNKVQIAGPDECWLWTGKSRTGRPGYAKYAAFRLTETKTVRAHRFMWELGAGPIPAGLCVCHSCDNRLCVNPAHLFLGTHADNIRDRDAKGRHRAPKGTENGHAKLTDEVVRAILTSTDSQRAIAARFGVNQSQVSRIRRGKAWTHVSPSPRPSSARAAAQPQTTRTRT